MDSESDSSSSPMVRKPKATNNRPRTHYGNDDDDNDYKRSIDLSATNNAYSYKVSSASTSTSTSTNPMHSHVKSFVTPSKVLDSDSSSESDYSSDSDSDSSDSDNSDSDSSSDSSSDISGESKKKSKSKSKLRKYQYKQKLQKLRQYQQQQQRSNQNMNQTVDVTQLVNNSTGTGLLAGGVLPDDNSGDELSSDESDESVSCNICTSALRNVVKLKCKHKFCYACIKGYLMLKNRTCPYCQESISPKFIRLILTEPNKVCKKIEKIDSAANSYWLYDSRDSKGWWNFDNKSNSYLERDYQNWISIPNHAYLDHRYTLQVCGTIMEIDFKTMMQINPTTGVQRRILRVNASELQTLKENNQLKGIGGIFNNNKQ